jgi:hypothetical protein
MYNIYSLLNGSQMKNKKKGRECGYIPALMVVWSEAGLGEKKLAGKTGPFFAAQVTGKVVGRHTTVQGRGPDISLDMGDQPVFFLQQPLVGFFSVQQAF